MSRIVFISPYRDLSILAEEVAQTLDIGVEIYDGSMEEAKDVIDKLDGPPVDIFISRGGTASFIASHYDAPVVSVNTGPFDILECLDEARQYSRHIAITSFAKPYIGMRLLERVMGITITGVIFHSLADLEEQIATLAESERYCVVGGGPSVRFAERYALSNVFLRTGRDTIHDALLRAKELAELQREEKRKASRLNAILSSVYDGIIAVDQEGRVELFNQAAETILHLNKHDVLNKQATDVIPNTRLDEVLTSGQSEISEFQDVGNVRIVTNRVPIKDGQEVVGAVATFQDVSRVMQVERKVRKELTATRFASRFTFHDVIGQSQTITDRKQLAESFARSDLTVLIHGASGTGKELFAQSIHHASRRTRHPFVAVNCGALPPTLLESELFGYEEGAFTGAKRKGKHGLFELAHTGTIFLDEIDALPIDLQGRLLRVLQEKEVLRIGGENIIPVNMRVIAATNQPPRKLLSENKIRADLFYRLNVLYLELPPLAARKEDIPLLCRHFLPPQIYQNLTPLLEQLMDYMLAYSWPGNIRELYNFTQRLSFFQNKYDAGMSARELLQGIAPNMLDDIDGSPSHPLDLRTRLAQEEKQRILDTVKSSRNVEAAAAKLGIGKSTLWRKLKQMKEDDSLFSQFQEPVSHK